MTHRYYSLLFILLFSLSQMSCGGGSQPGAPGSHGDTGVILDATVIPFYNGANTSNVDVVQDICDPGPPPVVEIFTDHGATVTVAATLLSPTINVQPGTLFIEQYTVDYYRSSDSVGAPPILSERRFDTVVITPPAVGSTVPNLVTFSAMLVDLPRKDQYLTDILSGQFNNPFALINNYTAVFTFYGKNQYGKDFSFTASTNFAIGHYDYCGG